MEEIDYVALVLAHEAEVVAYENARLQAEHEELADMLANDSLGG